MPRLMTVLLLVVIPARAAAQERPPPVIDMHLHALPAASQGPPPLGFCPGGTTAFVVPPSGSRWPATFLEAQKQPPCDRPVWSATTDDELMQRTLEIMERRNVYGVVSGPLVDVWHRAAPDRLIPSLMLGLQDGGPPVDSVRAWVAAGRYAALGEVTIQYEGREPADPAFAPYLALAAELDIPVGIHIGTGPPGAPYLGFRNYRARLHSPLLLEDVLVRHPDLRIYIMHAGWPMLDELLALMWTHPQVYVDVGIISFALPRPAFHRYLHGIVEAGFGSRVLFGSDQMVWPDALEHAIEAIESAGFLTADQKRAILYDNAARFLRLTDAEIERHHGRR